jgi:purine nucleoside permease
MDSDSERMMKRTIVFSLLAYLAATVLTPAHAKEVDSRDVGARNLVKPKVMIVTMFEPERNVWSQHLQGPWRSYKVEGLSEQFPSVLCNTQDVCFMTTAMGHANAAASMMALAFSPYFDLRNTYFLITGIGGIDPQRGTLGTAAWAKYLVEFSIQWELDGRQLPHGWPTGYLAVNAKGPDEKPGLIYGTEVFALNSQLADRAFALSRNVTLADNPQAQAARSKYNYAPANQPPAVVQCDSLSGDTWWSGSPIDGRARQWMRIMTDGKGTYCTTQQEDNATYEALKRAAAAGRVDVNRIAVLRTGGNFNTPYEGETNADNLMNFEEKGGFPISLENLYRAANPVIRDIVNRWGEWREGVPSS